MNTTSWKWYHFNDKEVKRLKDSIEEVSNLEIRKWVKEFQFHQTNCLEINIIDHDQYVIKGSLVYDQNFDNEKEFKIFHFYLSNKLLILVDLDFSMLKHTNIDLIQRQITKSNHPIEGILLVLRALLTKYLYKIDQFESDLMDLVWSIRKKNKTSLLDKIFMRRQELLIWKNLLIPMKELLMGIEEVHDEISDNKVFIRTSKRMDRALYLINQYVNQVNSIINLEEVISSHRGNEIMKTLTVLTAIFTPVMAWGALWGMNFKFMPELEWKYGYLISIILILISMIVIYLYLKMKGWTGDLLKGKKKGSFFK